VSGKTKTRVAFALMMTTTAAAAMGKKKKSGSGREKQGVTIQQIMDHA